ncbi:hypothetical protein K1T71_015057 [Dendrolimus kikuchii]|nr:hypothetical protein K1T71_015057 [Dendrolimus kikuchii]
MSKIAICRVCFSVDRRMYSINNSLLQEIWERLTNTSFDSSDGKPLFVCYICYAHLRKSHQLMKNALKAEELLTAFIENGLEQSESLISSIASQTYKFEYNYAIAPQDCTEYNVNETDVVEELKKEDKEYSNHKESIDIDHVDSCTDSDDNVPLKTISVKKQVKREVRKRIERKPRKIILKKIDKGKKLDVIEIDLTKEEQINELMKRCQTQNYMYSPFRCELCYKGFVDTKAYENHKDRHSECYNIISSRKSTSYLSHVRKVHPSENVCNICGECFVGRLGLMLHKTKTHRKEEARSDNGNELASDCFCSECNMQFSNLDAWKRHILSSVKHTLANENDTQCKICRQNVVRGNLVAHLKEHDKKMRKEEMKKKTAAVNEVRVASLACNECDAKFSTSVKLTAHVKRMHLGVKYDKNIVCEVCGKKFMSNAALTYHQRSHTGERPFECTTCGKRFRETYQLRLHVRTHTGERPYCCNTRFSPLQVHTGSKPYECQYCSRAFSQSNSLKGHIRTVHLKIPAKRRKTQNTVEIVPIVEKQDLHDAVL